MVSYDKRTNEVLERIGRVAPDSRARLEERLNEMAPVPLTRYEWANIVGVLQAALGAMNADDQLMIAGLIARIKAMALGHYIMPYRHHCRVNGEPLDWCPHFDYCDNCHKLRKAFCAHHDCERLTTPTECLICKKPTDLSTGVEKENNADK